MENTIRMVYTLDMQLPGEETGAVLENEGQKIVDSVAKEQSPEEKKKKKKTRIITLIVFLVVNAVVLSYTAVNEFSNKPPGKLEFHFGFSNYMLLLAGLGCAVAALLIEAGKYLLMMKTLKVKVSAGTAFETAALGKYYDNITPSGIGGQPFQIYNLYKHGYSSGTSLAMPLTAFLTMQTGFVILALLMFVFKGDVIDILALRIAAYIGVVCYMIVPVMIVLFTISKDTAVKMLWFILRFLAKIRILKDPESRLRSLTRILEEYRESIILIGKKKGLLFLLLVLSFLYQVSISSIPFFVLLAYNGTASYFEILAMTMFVYCSITFIPTPGNSGAAEGSFYLIFSRLDPTGLFWSMLVWRVICYYSFIVIGLLIYGHHAVLSLMKRKRE